MHAIAVSNENTAVARAMTSARHIMDEDYSEEYYEESDELEYETHKKLKVVPRGTELDAFYLFTSYSHRTC